MFLHQSNSWFGTGVSMLLWKLKEKHSWQVRKLFYVPSIQSEFVLTYIQMGSCKNLKIVWTNKIALAQLYIPHHTFKKAIGFFPSSQIN